MNEYIIDMHAPHEELKRQVDYLWMFIYTNQPIIECAADEDGKIYFTVIES